MGKKFLSVDQQEEVGILSPEVRARMAAAYANGGDASAAAAGEAPAAPTDAAPPGQTALFNAWEGRGRVQPLRRPHGENGQLLHVPRLRNKHRL